MLRRSESEAVRNADVSIGFSRESIIFRLTRSARRFITKKIHYNEPIRQHAPVWGRPENHLGTAISAAEAGKAWNHGVNNSGSTLKNAPGAAAV